jgi:hypothetical protein
MSPSLAAQRRDHLLTEAEAHRATREIRSRPLVLQRRLQTPFQRLRLLLTNPIASSALRAATAMRFEEPFELAGTPMYPVVRARAALVTTNGQSIAKVAMEVAPWSRSADSDLLLRPYARHPERWSNRRLSRYFAHAHSAADEFTDLLQFTALLIQTRTTVAR